MKTDTPSLETPQAARLRRRQLIRQLLERDKTPLAILFMAAVVGTLVGLAAVAFDKGVAWLQNQRMGALVHTADNYPLLLTVAFLCSAVLSPQVEAYLHKELSSYDLSTYGELVLGCTHFNYFKDSFRKIMPSQVQIIDGNRGTVNQLKRILESTDRLERSEGKVRYFTSGREVVASEQLARMDRLHARLEEMSRIK